MRPSTHPVVRRAGTFAALNVILALTASPAEATTASFASPSWVQVTSPSSIATADFDGDGRVDVAIVDGVDQQLVVLHNNGSTFTRSTSALGRNTGALTATDVDGDGDPDLVMETTAGKAAELTVMPNLGGGLFGSPTQYGLGTYQRLAWFNGVALGDIDGDGQPDVAAPSGGATYILHNDGGRLGLTASYPLPATRAVAAQLADLNGDGHLDLVVAHWRPSGVEVRFGAGDGTFGDPQEYSVSANPLSIVVADIDGDGAADLVVPRADSGKVAILFNDHTGHFPTRKGYSIGAYPGLPAVADLDGDGRPDIAAPLAIYPDTASIAVISNLGGRHFTAPTFYSGGHYPLAVSTGDFDQDGRLDLAVDANQDNAVGFLLQPAPGG